MATCEVTLNAALAPGQEDCEYYDVRTKCYRCGQRACKSCSWIDMDPYVHRRTRRCRDCREQEDR